MCKFIVGAVCSTLAVCLCTCILHVCVCPAMRPSLQRRSEQPGDEWAAKFSSRRWQPPTGSGEAPCTIATGSYSAPFDEKPGSPDNALQLRSFLVFFLPCPDSSKEAGVVRTHMQAFVELDCFGKAGCIFLWSGKTWIKDEAGVLLSHCGSGTE